jgi:AcrR family transcriptional regulator
MSVPPSGTVRRGGRTARTRTAVLAAALEEVNLYGYSAFSTLRVAQRAGVHRTTVHRRWPSHADLITDALLEDASTAVAIPDTGEIRSDLELLLEAIAALIDTDDTRPRIRSLVADSARSPAIGAVVKRVWTERFALGEEVITRAQQRGEVRPDIAASTLLAMFTGPLYLRLLITDERLDTSFLADVITAGLNGVRRN